MLERLPSILGEYLQQVGGLEPVNLGVNKAGSVTVDDQRRLVNQLGKESGFNKKLIVCITILHFLLFVLAAWLVFYHRDSPRTISLILGGSILSLLPIIKSLSKLWREKTAMDMLQMILPTLSPDQAVKIIQAIYFGRIQAYKSAKVKG